MSDWPSITLVTPSYNQGDYLAQTIESVLDQQYPNLDYMILDGGSTDQSVAIIRRYERHLSYWVSAPDGGQSAAIRAGFARASGVLMNWLNSDDLLLPGALQAVAERYLETRADLIVGEDLHFEQSPDRPVKHLIPQHYEWPTCIRFWEGRFLHHQPCTYFTRALYERVGGVRSELHYVMDTDLYCRMLREPGIRVAYLARPISAFRLHEASKTCSRPELFEQEMITVCERLLPDTQRQQDLAAMYRYITRWALHRAASAGRRGQYAAAARDLRRAWGYSPAETIAYGAARLWQRLRGTPA